MVYFFIRNKKILIIDKKTYEKHGKSFLQIQELVEKKIDFLQYTGRSIQNGLDHIRLYIDVISSNLESAPLIVDQNLLITHRKLIVRNAFKSIGTRGLNRGREVQQIS